MSLHAARPSGRLIVVSNRLPVTVEEQNGNVEFVPSAGGLATGLKAIRSEISSWIGWPGTVSKSQQAYVSEHLQAAHGCSPVFLSERLVEKYYEGFSNRTIWPLFHSFQSYAKYSANEWAAYAEANQRFLQALDPVLRPGDRVWIHDYQLLLLPGLLRQRYPDLGVGFFLHIPFPPYEVLRMMPQHRMILESLLGADLIGFHTNDYSRSFLNCVYRALGIDDRLGQMIVGERVVESIVRPMGIDVELFSSSSRTLENAPGDLDLKSALKDVKVIFSVSRLDYTKGIPQSLESFELLLSKRPELRGKVAFVLAVVPSREKVDRYADLKRKIDEMVGRINARYGDVRWTPIRYLYRHLSFDELVSLYKNSDVALVSPLRDGLNLVAKEYVAARNDDRGVLVLSEMAGAAKELLEAVLVNPNSREDLCAALDTALFMPEMEQASRMRALRERLLENPVQNWSLEFVKKLDQVTVEGRKLARETLSLDGYRRMAARAQGASRRLFIFDYDGTLMPLMDRPDQVIPDSGLKDLLRRLARVPGSDVLILSGRSRADLEKWLGGLGVSLAAEHGAAVCWAGAKAWTELARDARLEWKAEVHQVLRSLVEKIPGSFVEEKAYSLVWHYRKSDRESADAAAKELTFHLLGAVGEHPVRIIPGSRSVEIRCNGIGKGSFVKSEIDLSNYDFVLGAGDDWTDEDLFGVLPETAFSIRVGAGFSKARFRVRDHLELRRLIGEFGPRETSVEIGV